jgi:CO/xanthine dehydrogenase Mo-binding subunit
MIAEDLGLDPLEMAIKNGLQTGEGTLDPAAPAIANAIYNATGVRFKELPITAEKILKELKGRTSGRQ